jgi:hypothetical protein
MNGEKFDTEFVAMLKDDSVSSDTKWGMLGAVAVSQHKLMLEMKKDIEGIKIKDTKMVALITGISSIVGGGLVVLLNAIFG